MSADALCVDVQRMASLLAFIEPSLPKLERRTRYSHMGALLADVALQASVNYESVVAPRIRRILRVFGEHASTSEMLAIIREHDVKWVLDWQHPEKPKRFVSLLRVCCDMQVETVDGLRTALLRGHARQRIGEVRGIGPKSVDYLQLLAGVEAVPVDRHMEWLLRVAGTKCRGYEQRQAVIVQACRQLGWDLMQADQALWQLLRQL